MATPSGSASRRPNVALDRFVERERERVSAEVRTGVLEAQSKLSGDLTQFPEDLQKAGLNLWRAQESVRQMREEIYRRQLALYDARSETERYLVISDEITNLQTMDKALVQEEKKERGPFLDATIAHSKAYCQEFSAAITRALPREIRNMIYGYLCQKVVRITVDPPDGGRENSTAYMGTKTPYRTYLARRRTSLPYLFSRKYFTKDFLFELVSELYSRVTFHIWDAADIENFLSQDFFGVGCLPKRYARALSLVLFTDAVEQSCTSKRDIQQKLSHLNKLFQLEHQRGFRLDLHLCISGHSHRPTVARFHQILLPYLYKFKNAGFTIRLPLRKHSYGEDQKTYRTVMNQLQAADSTHPEDWVVDDEELQAWKESEVIQNAFKLVQWRDGGTMPMTTASTTSLRMISTGLHRLPRFRRITRTNPWRRTRK